jgi:uncharacterized RDD family membrane protein YckC
VSLLIDGILDWIPYAALVFWFINWFQFRRGTSIGMRITKTRILRTNGSQVS